jgi:hypothetical protein
MKPKKEIKARNWNAVDAHFRNSAGSMKDRRSERGGTKNDNRDLIGDYYDDLFVCDFCGYETFTVRRIVLDRNYDRILGLAQYACELCSDKKEEERLMGNVVDK